MRIVQLIKFSIITLLIVTCCVQAATNELKIITLKHRLAADLLPSIQVVIGSEGTASALNENLLIRTTPGHMAEVEQLISALDTPQQNLRITVSYSKRQQESNQATDINADVRVKRSRITQLGAEANVELSDSTSNNQFSQQSYLNVLDGELAYIRVGQSVAFTQQWRVLAQQYSLTQSSQQFVDISTGFSVRPHKIGNRVSLEVRPRFASLNNAGFVDFDTLATVVNVELGQWFDLGGVMQNRDEVSRAILSNRNQTSQETTDLRIKVE